MYKHQRKSCKMPTPDSGKYTYVKKKKKKMCALVANCTKGD